jgi:dynein light chain LC8-type
MADTKQDVPSGGDSASSNTQFGANPKAVIKNVDMAEEMQQETIDIATAALEKFSVEKDIAANIKKEFDRKYGPTWHVVVGKNFGSYVTHGESQRHPVQFGELTARQKRSISFTSTWARSPFLSGSRDRTIYESLLRDAFGWFPSIWVGGVTIW